MKKNLYTPDNFFFDDMLSFLIALSSIGLGLQTQKKKIGKPCIPKQVIVLHGKPSVTGIEYKFFPYETLQIVFENKWPTSFELLESKLETPLDKFPDVINSRNLGVIHLLQAIFVRFYSSIVDRIENNYSKNCTKLANGFKVLASNTKCICSRWKDKN